MAVLDSPAPPRLPAWLRRPRTANPESAKVAARVRDLKLNTVCEDARCPNLHECWSAGTATFMVLGDRCTRRCGFCSIATAKPLAVDAAEPERLGVAVAELGLAHVVITSVARDDLPDQGAGHFAACIRAVRAAAPGSTVEVLVPDFRGEERLIDLVLAAAPEVYNHNLETVRRLAPAVRPQARHDRTLAVLGHAARTAPATLVKSGMMLGLGETDAETEEALRELRDAGCRLLTLGQYLRPTPAHLPVARFVPPADFDRWGARALALGFLHAASSPFARSSHHAAEALAQARRRLQEVS